jgi:hypothetical protein
MGYYCRCGRFFNSDPGLTNHKNTCTEAKEESSSFHFALRNQILGKHRLEQDFSSSSSTEKTANFPASASATNALLAIPSPTLLSVSHATTSSASTNMDISSFTRCLSSSTSDSDPRQPIALSETHQNTQAPQ